MKSFRLIACREDGTLEQQTVELAWNTILQWESDEESMAFCFEYSRNEKPPRWVKVYTPYVSIMTLCAKKLRADRLIATELNMRLLANYHKQLYIINNFQSISLAARCRFLFICSFR